MSNVDELRPPPEHADKPLHWLLHEAEGAPECFQWVPSHEWVMHGSSVFFKPERMAGYRYLGPAEWLEEPKPAADHPIWGDLQRADIRIAELEAEVAALKGAPDGLEAEGVLPAPVAVTFGGSNGSGATAVVQVREGTVTAVSLTSPRGYYAPETPVAVAPTPLPATHAAPIPAQALKGKR